MFSETPVKVPADKVLTVLSDLDSLFRSMGYDFLFYPIGSTANPKDESKDVDVMVDAAEFLVSTGCSSVGSAKDCFTMHLATGVQARQKGVSVHLLIPVDGVGNVQVDIMLAYPADAIVFYHVHGIPTGSPYKGKHRHMLMSYLARKKGLLWSPYRGLYTRKASGKRDQLVSYDPDEVAHLLTGGLRDTITSADAILRSIDNPDEILKDLVNDRQWNRQ